VKSFNTYLLRKGILGTQILIKISLYQSNYCQYYRPAVQHSFSSFYVHDKDDVDVSPTSLKSSSDHWEFESLARRNELQNEDRQKTITSDKIQNNDSELASAVVSPINPSLSLRSTLSSPVNPTNSAKSTPSRTSVKTSDGYSSGSKKKLNSDIISSSNTSVSSESSSSSSKKKKVSTKSKDTIKDRFMLSQSKLELLLAPIQLPPTTSSYASNGYAKRK